EMLYDWWCLVASPWRRRKVQQFSRRVPPKRTRVRSPPLCLPLLVFAKSNHVPKVQVDLTEDLSGAKETWHSHNSPALALMERSWNKASRKRAPTNMLLLSPILPVCPLCPLPPHPLSCN
ncbi:hypothetical protein H1C71_000260, partial [Ictidomys tridecemlineatus]